MQVDQEITDRFVECRPGGQHADQVRVLGELVDLESREHGGVLRALQVGRDEEKEDAHPNGGNDLENCGSVLCP